MRKHFELSILLLWLCCRGTVASSCFNETRGACWDLGVEYEIESAEACQNRCFLWPNCQAFMYLPEIQKCHYCSSEDLDWSKNCDDGCVYGPATCQEGESLTTVTTLLQSALRTASSVCTHDEITMKNDAGESVLQAVSNLHQIIRFRDIHKKDTGFQQAYDQAIEDATRMLASSNNCIGPCSGLLKFQLLSMVLLEHPYASSLVFPGDEARAKLFDDFQILLADNDFLNDASIDVIYDVFNSLPDHLANLSTIDGAPFAVQYFADAYDCDTSIDSLVDVSNVTYSISQLVQVKEGEVQAFPTDTQIMPPPDDKLLALVKHSIASKFYQIVTGNPRLSAMLNYLYLQSKQGADDRHWLGNEGSDFFSRNPNDIFSSQIGQQYMVSSSSQLNLALGRWGSYYFDNFSQSSSGGKRCDQVDKQLGNVTSRLACRRAASNDDMCKGNFFMFHQGGDCQCCSDGTQFSEDGNWTIYKYRETTAPKIPTALPMSWWLLNVDIFAVDAEATTSIFYEYDEEAEAVVPICVRLFRDDKERISTIEVPGCGLLDFEYSTDQGFVVESVTDNALECRPDPSLSVCKLTSQTEPPSDIGPGSGSMRGLSMIAPPSFLVLASAVVVAFSF